LIIRCKIWNYINAIKIDSTYNINFINFILLISTIKNSIFKKMF
jgi:hypothetical protein